MLKFIQISSVILTYTTVNTWYWYVWRLKLWNLKYFIYCTVLYTVYIVQWLKIFSKKLKRCKSFSHCECFILDGLPHNSGHMLSLSHVFLSDGWRLAELLARPVTRATSLFLLDGWKLDILLARPVTRATSPLPQIWDLKSSCSVDHSRAAVNTWTSKSSIIFSCF